MPENKSSQLYLIPTDEPVTPAGSYLLVPFSTANLARVFADCFLRGTATGVNRNDAQSKSDSFLIAHEKVVPQSAVAQCATEGGTPVVVQLDATGLDVSESGDIKAIRCPVATNHVVKVSFASEEELEEASVRIGRFPDIPWASFEYDVNAALFSDQNEVTSKEVENIKFPEDKGAKEAIDRALDIGGVFASHLALVQRSGAFDRWLIDIYSKIDKASDIREVIYQSVAGDLNPDPSDKVAWDICWDYLATRDSADGFSNSDFFDHARTIISELTDEVKEQATKWVEFCSDVVSSKKDFPKNWKCSGNPALRAVLLFSLTYSRDKLHAFVNEYEVENHIVMFAESLAGKFETIRRIPAKEKAPSRVTLNQLSAILVRLSSGQPVTLNVGKTTFSADGNLEEQIYFEGLPLVSRRQPVSQPFSEIFVKAQRLGMVRGYDQETGAFFIEREQKDGRGVKALRIYCSIEDINNHPAQKRVYFYVPAESFATSRAPAAKKLKKYLENAWIHKVGVGTFEQGNRSVFAYFWAQMVDTFDAIEFADMVSRFESALSG